MIDASDFTKAELVAKAEALGVAATGTKDELAAAINERMESAVGGWDPDFDIEKVEGTAEYERVQLRAQKAAAAEAAAAEAPAEEPATAASVEKTEG